jgi:hypothetical protein
MCAGDICETTFEEVQAKQYALCEKHFCEMLLSETVNVTKRACEMFFFVKPSCDSSHEKCGKNSV